MPRLSLDFANAQRNLAAPRLGVGIGILAAGAIALGAAAWEYSTQMEDNAALLAKQESLEARMQRQKPSAAIPPEIAALAEQAGAAYAQILTPWEEIFQALEAARSNDIALLSLTADASKQEISMTGEARNFAALSAFADSLSSNALFRKATVANHKLSEGAQPIVVRFDFALAWRRPDGEALPKQP